VVNDGAEKSVNIIQNGPEKPYKVQCIIILQPFTTESWGLHQNAQKLTGNVKKWQIMDM